VLGNLHKEVGVSCVVVRLFFVCHNVLRQRTDATPHIASVVPQVYDYQQTQMMLQYGAFTQTEGAYEEGQGTKWPAFRPVGAGGLLSAPSYKNLESYCDAKFEEVR